MIDASNSASLSTQDQVNIIAGELADHVQATDTPPRLAARPREGIAIGGPRVGRRLRKTNPPGVDDKTIMTLAARDADRRADAFYERFEDTFRESQDDIRGDCPSTSMCCESGWARRAMSSIWVAVAVSSWSYSSPAVTRPTAWTSMRWPLPLVSSVD